MCSFKNIVSEFYGQRRYIIIWLWANESTLFRHACIRVCLREEFPMKQTQCTHTHTHTQSRTSVTTLILRLKCHREKRLLANKYSYKMSSTNATFARPLRHGGTASVSTPSAPVKSWRRGSTEPHNASPGTAASLRPHTTLTRRRTASQSTCYERLGSQKETAVKPGANLWRTGRRYWYDSGWQAKDCSPLWSKSVGEACRNESSPRDQSVTFWRMRVLQRSPPVPLKIPETQPGYYTMAPSCRIP
jgi:hypothetical protein